MFAETSAPETAVPFLKLTLTETSAVGMLDGDSWRSSSSPGRSHARGSSRTPAEGCQKARYTRCRRTPRSRSSSSVRLGGGLATSSCDWAHSRQTATEQRPGRWLWRRRDRCPTGAPRSLADTARVGGDGHPVELYATKSYELTAVMFLVWIESWTGFRVAPAAPDLLVEVAARSWGAATGLPKKE